MQLSLIKLKYICIYESARNPNKEDLVKQIVRNNSRERSSEPNEKEICGRKRSLTTSLQLRYAPRNRAFTLRRPRSPLPRSLVYFYAFYHERSSAVFKEKPLVRTAGRNYSMNLSYVLFN